jgi:hypothetical protein
MSPRYRHQRLRSTAGVLPAALLFFSLAGVSVLGGSGLLALCLLPAGLALDLARAETAKDKVATTGGRHHVD